MARTSPQYAIIASGDVLSSAVPMLNAKYGAGIGMILPTLSSGSAPVRLWGSVTDTASASFQRLRDPFTGSAHWLLQANLGANGAEIGDVVTGFVYLRVEAAIAQTDNRSITILPKV